MSHNETCRAGLGWDGYSSAAQAKSVCGELDVSKEKVSVKRRILGERE